MICMLLFILMEEASPIPVMGKENYEGILKKLAAREKKSVELGLEEECKRKYSVNHNYQQSVNYYSLNPLRALRPWIYVTFSFLRDSDEGVSPMSNRQSGGPPCLMLKNEKPAFSSSSSLKSVLEKLRFRER